MKVLDAGTAPMSNMDVLQWIKRKREQHAAEDAEDTAARGKPQPRPANFMSALSKHERILESDDYPYRKNPEAYLADAEVYGGVRRLHRRLLDDIVLPLGAAPRPAVRGATRAQRREALTREQAKKDLTETEQLMLYNHAPRCVEMLQPMIENCDERFTPAEQQKIVRAIADVYRYNEPKPPEST